MTKSLQNIEYLPLNYSSQLKNESKMKSFLELMEPLIREKVSALSFENLEENIFKKIFNFHYLKFLKTTFTVLTLNQFILFP